MLTQRANLKSRAPQVTERDEYAYQEMIAHVPLHAHRDDSPEPLGLMPCAFLGVQRRARAWHGRTSSTRGRA